MAFYSEEKRDIILDEKECFSGVEGAKGVNTDKLLQPWMVQEYIKCAKDPEYFIENYIKISTVDGDEILFKLYPYQQEMLEMLVENRLNIFLCCRQAGKSQLLAGYALWCLIFKRNYKIKWLSNKLETAQEMIARVKYSYIRLPIWLQKQIFEWNKTSLSIENESKISCSSTTENSGRGSSISLLLLDEFAFVDRKIQDAFLASVFPTILSGKKTQMCIISTPHGQERFYEIYTQAQRGINNFGNILVTWVDVPGRDDEWKKMVLEINGPKKFAVEMECSFEESSNTLISAEALNKSFKSLTPTYKQFLTEGPDNFFEIYHPYNPLYKYHIQVDPSQGKGNDYTIISVFEYNPIDNKVKQAALWRCNVFTTPQILDYLLNIALQYSYPSMGVENNGVGASITEKLYYDHEYPNLIFTKKNSKTKKIEILNGFISGCDIGVHTTNPIKLAGGDKLVRLFEENKIEIYNKETFKEFQTFVKDRASYQAEKGHNDDICMTWLLFAWLSEDTNFHEIMGGGSEDIGGEDNYISPIPLNSFQNYISIEDWMKS